MRTTRLLDAPPQATPPLHHVADDGDRGHGAPERRYIYRGYDCGICAGSSTTHPWFPHKMFNSQQRKPYFGLTGGWLTTWITIACATDMTLFGYDQAVFSGVVVTDNFLELHNLVGPSKTDVLATVSAIYAVGCFFGALVAFTAGERLGRKKTILLGTHIMTIGAILQAASYNLPMMFVGRVVSGYMCSHALRRLEANAMSGSATASTRPQLRSGRLRLPQPSGVASW